VSPAKFIYIGWIFLLLAWLLSSAVLSIRQGLNPTPVLVMTSVGLLLAGYALSLTRGAK
jgi:hypothetical protein